MKKLTCLFFVLFSLFPTITGVTQDLKQKFELSPSREINDSRFPVTATVMDNDTWCRVEWPGFYNYDELAYDDGEVDDYFIFSSPGGINANKFTPWFYPAEVTGGEIYVGNGSYPGPFLGTLFRVLIFNDDGVNGLPGTVLDSLDVTVENYYWVEFEGLSVMINSGSFYLGMKQLAPSPDAAPVGVDMDYPTYDKSYIYLDGSGWVTSPLQDFMIRARIASGNNNGDVDYYQVDRFSNFDPNGSPLLGDTTFLDTRTNPYYNDHDWASLPMGWFAYGVKEHYIDGGWSDYYLSNIVGHLMSITVTINVMLCDTLWWGSTVIRVNGEEVPATLTTDGAFTILEFNTLPPIPCDIEVYCPGNDAYSLSNIYIADDIVINIPLMCIAYPVRNLNVDPVSMIATWESPQVVPEEQNFEGASFPPSGWQMQSQGNGWFRTDDGSGGGWTIPGWNSNYACTNDLLTGENDGSQDYLIGTSNRLDYRWDYKLRFDSYFDGFNNQDAYVEYSIDGGEWDVLYEMDPSEGWESVELDLSMFSGPEGPPEVWFAFHADDNGQDASGWAVDNIRIYSPDPPYTLDGYWVYVDDSLFAINDTNFIDLSPLTYGESYTIKVKALYLSGLSSPVTDTVFCEYLYPPSCFYQADTNIFFLIMCPPMDSTGNIPSNFIGYNLYRDMDFISFIPYPPGPPIGYIDDGIQPGVYQYGLRAVYDLTPYGYPGETGESMMLITECIIRYGYPLPFLEQWNLGNFDENNWLTDGSNWSITGQHGNPSPAAEFTWDPIQSEYALALESYPLQADSMTEGQIYLDVDIKLDNVVATGTEQMLIQVWNWDSQAWANVSTYSNQDGSFDWLSEHLDITAHAMGTVFKIRFHALGENSVNILSWFLDNIHVYRACNAPLNLEAHYTINPYGISLDWDSPEEVPADQWIHWDDGVNTGNSIGGPMIFDVAARWEPEQLDQFAGGELTAIAFFPGEENASYSVRAWIGAGAANMVVDQVVPAPIIGAWNYVTLATPVPVDVTQELWVGYFINAETGYPAGVDNGPAIDGYGNMLNFGGWQTLLQINPELDYNWNIAAFIQHDSMISDTLKYAIYRSDDGSPYFFLDYSNQNYFFDESACDPFGVFREYKISALYIHGNDTCESGFSNEAADVCSGINGNSEISFVNIYPNPCNDLFKIESSEELRFVSIYNSQGQIILKIEVDDATTGIPVKEYKPGLYLVKVETAKENIFRKIMIIRK